MNKYTLPVSQQTDYKNIYVSFIAFLFDQIVEMSVIIIIFY